MESIVNDLERLLVQVHRDLDREMLRDARKQREEQRRREPRKQLQRTC